MVIEVQVTPPTVPGVLAGGDGSFAHPFHSVTGAMAHVKEHGGGVVLVHGGHYVESVRLTAFGGNGDAMVVRAAGIGEVFIDSMLPEFLAPQGPEDRWSKVIPEAGPFLGEYVWGRHYPTEGSLDDFRVHRGAFLDEPVHTRLLSYHRLEDLTATNQLWPDDSAGAHGENRVWRALPKLPGEPQMYRPEEREGHPKYRPWVYMGPGIWFDERGDRRVHVRLAPTANNVPGWRDYDPETTDPSGLRLALCRERDHAIFLENAHDIRFENLTLRFGNPDTVRLNSCTHITFDHCRIRSGSRALFLLADRGPNEDIALEHCVVDGGIPTWMFRSDRKDNYVFSTDRPPDTARRQIGSQLHEDNLAYATSGVQLSSQNQNCLRMVVHHSEIFNAHDSYIYGDQMAFHHNWVHNLNDDGIAMSGEADARHANIYCNVMTQCLTALSFATNRKLKPIHIYGNLFDLRVPTLGKRPTGEGAADSLRQGHFFKDGADEGPIFLFHNTCLVLDPGAKGDDRADLNRVGFSFYTTLKASAPRPAYNNIFVAAFTPAAHLKPIAYLAPVDFGPSDGNTYFRIPNTGTSSDDGPLDPYFRVHHVSGVETDDFFLPDLPEYRQHYWAGDPEKAYEKLGNVGDPGFKSFDVATGRPRRGDDLRLRFHPRSPAKGNVADMLDGLADMYEAATGERPLDRGCYPHTGARLRVGVDGRMVYPWMRPGPQQDTHTDDVPPVIR